jgi:hypothetical protein
MVGVGSQRTNNGRDQDKPDCPGSYVQALYVNNNPNPSLRQIVLNYDTSPTTFAEFLGWEKRAKAEGITLPRVRDYRFTIIFAEPRNPEEFEAILTRAGCQFDALQKRMNCFETVNFKNAIAALRGHEEYIPATVLSDIIKTAFPDAPSSFYSVPASEKKSDDMKSAKALRQTGGTAVSTSVATPPATPATRVVSHGTAGTAPTPTHT